MQISTSKISVLALILLITGAIDSVRNLPSTAIFGANLIFFFAFAAIVFLIPIALISAELASTWAAEPGGVYSWVKHAFGKSIAFFTIWLQWINTMVWYPSVLAFIAGTLAYLINPHLNESKFYIISVILVVFWSLTLLGLRGLNASARFASFCAIIGMILPMGLIIILGLIWIIKGNPIAIDLSFSHIIPTIKDGQSWVSLTAIITSFVGMELAAVHVREVKNPQQNFPKAILISVLLILMTMILGSLAIVFVLPPEKINLVGGVMQAFDNFLSSYHLQFCLPLVTVMVLIGSLGLMINWIISPARGLLLAAEHGFIPSFFNKTNQKGVASRILILQAVLVTIICTAFSLLPSINAIYWLFSALSTELYLLMYVLLIFAAMKIKIKFKDRHRPFKIPGGMIGYYFICALGLMGCVISLIVGFVPPTEYINTGDVSNYRLIFTGGLITMLLPAFLLFFRKKIKKKIVLSMQ